MTEDIAGRMNERANWTLEQRVAHHQELAQQRQQWEEHRRQEQEEHKRQEKQRRLEAYLKRRGEAYIDHTGMLPTQELLASWADSYVSQRLDEEEAERYARAEDHWS